MRSLFAAACAAALVASLVPACGSRPCDGTHTFCDPGSPDGDVDGGVIDAPVVFPDAPQGATFDVQPGDQTIPVTCGATGPGVQFTATTAVTWTVDRPEVGTMSAAGPATQSTFTPTGTTGGVVDVIARLQNQTVVRHVLVKLSCQENGGCPSTQIATSTSQILSGGGIGGVGGEGCGAGVTDAATLTALASPSGDGSAQNLKLLYPYDKTVWPRGLLAPLLQWDWSFGDADAIQIDLATTSGSFSWSGTFARPAILAQEPGKFIRHPIPEDVWTMATNTAGGLVNNVPDRLTAKVTLAYQGKAYGPISQTWTVAPGGLKGTVYYGSYGTRLSTSNWSNQIGASVLAIKHGATDPTLVTSKTDCQVCHGVGAKGSGLVAEQDMYPGNGQDYDVYYDLKTTQPPGSSLPTVNGLYTWGAVSPDGATYFSNSSAAWNSTDQGLEGSTTTPSGLYSLPSGGALVTPAQIASQLSLSTQLGGALPEFSPDGKHVVFTFFQGGPDKDGKSGDGKSLAVVDFDPNTKTFSNLRTIYTPTCAGCVATAPFFLPTSDGVVFELVTTSNGWFGGTAAMNGADTSFSNCANLTGARAELWWVDLATKTARRLDVANGLGYLPTGPNGHADDTTLQFDPTVAPVASGGYVWVAFTSRRLYGSVATLNPWCSQTNGVDFTPYSQNPMTKKLWVAAFDLNAKPGTDASHPAFYLPGQELTAGNFRSFWVLDPCKGDGVSCATGDECCGGHCTSAPDGGAPVCGAPNGCGGEGDTCVANGDCCNGLQCSGGPDNGHCDVVPVN